MPISKTLQSTLLWCGPFVDYLPLTVGGQEPALTCANNVLCVMLGPPFAWRWNRGEVAFVLTANVGDYAEVLSDFGYIEKATLQQADLVKTFEAQAKHCLAATQDTGRPQFVSAQKDDNAGTITFRFQSLPNEAYHASIQYQKKVTLLTSIASFWGVPDDLAHIYEWGFLALVAALNKDSRFGFFNQKFTSSLLGAQQGIDEVQREIFLGNWLEITKAAERAQLRTSQGVGASQL